MDERDFHAMNKIKTKNVFGVELTSIQNMKFSQYLQRPEVPSMNTLTKQQRFELVKKWLENELSEH